MKETNMEHYRSEIEAVEYSIALHNGEVKGCNSGTFNCIGCNFQNMYKGLGCQRATIKWLMSEYKPEPVLTAREKHFVECVEDGWLTKSNANTITWWEKKPSRDGKRGWIVIDTGGCVMLQEIHPHAFGDMFPFITWEDEEPWAVEDLRKLKVKAGDQDA